MSFEHNGKSVAEMGLDWIKGPQFALSVYRDWVNWEHNGGQLLDKKGLLECALSV